MPEDERIPRRVLVPRPALRRLQESLIPQTNLVLVDEKPPILELRAIAEDTEINVREFGSFIDVADRLYGSLSPRGFRSYSRRRDAQLTISVIRSGSIEISFLESLWGSIGKDSLLAILFLWTLLKGLGPFAKELAKAYKEYQHGALIRDLRSKITDQGQSLSTGEVAELATADASAIVRYLAGR
jgi:hypothetical protein